MKTFYRILAVLGLLLTIVPPVMRFTGTMTEENMKTWVFVGTVIWFIGATPWLGKKEVDSTKVNI